MGDRYVDALYEPTRFRKKHIRVLRNQPGPNKYRVRKRKKGPAYSLREKVGLSYL